MPSAGTYFVQLLGFTGRPLLVTLYKIVDQTGPITMDGTPVDLHITTPGQQARFTFTGIKGKFVSAVVSPDLDLLLYRPDGTWVGSPSHRFLDAILPLDVTGTWTLAVMVPTGYSLPVTGAVQGYMFRDHTQGAGLDGEAQKVNLYPFQDARFKFQGESGLVVSGLLSRSSTFGPCAPLKPAFTLVRPNGTTAATGSCSGGRKFIDAFTLDATGVWTFLVHPYDTPEGTVTFQGYHFTDATGSVTIDGPSAPVNIAAPGQNAAFTFTAPTRIRTSRCRSRTCRRRSARCSW